MARRARLKDLQAQIKRALLSAVIIDDLPGLSAISSWILTSFSLPTTPPLFSLFFYPPTLTLRWNAIFTQPPVSMFNATIGHGRPYSSQGRSA